MIPAQFQQTFRPAPIYVFAGEEDLFKLEGIRRIRTELLPNASAEIGFTEFEPEEVDLATVLDELNTLSLFGGNRLVLLQRADKFFGLAGKQESESEPEGEEAGESKNKALSYRELLLKALESPSPNAALIITTENKWGRYRKLAQRIEKVGFLVDCERPRHGEIPQWLMQRAVSRYQKKLVGKAAHRLAQDGGESLLQLDNQLAKLATFVRDRDHITEEEVRELVAKATHDNIFELTEAAGSKSPGRAMEVLHDLLFHGASENFVIAMLTWHIRRLWEAKKLRNAGASPANVQEALKLNPYFADKFMRQVSKFTEPELQNAYRALLAADVATKSGYEPEVVVEQLVMELSR